MKQQETIIPSMDSIAITNGQHPLGSGAKKTDRFEVSLTSVFSSIHEELRSLSHILTLPDNASKAEIMEAYRHDVELLTKRVEEFDSMVRNMMHYGMKLWQKERQPYLSIDEPRKKAITEFLWNEMQKDLPQDQLMAKAMIWINADEHILEPAQLNVHLKERVTKGMLRQVRIWNSYFNTLVEKDMLGLVEWKSDSVCKYHYFTHEGVVHTLMTHKYEQHEGGWTKGFEQAVNEYTNFKIRVEHHLTDANEHIIKDFPDGMPDYAASFLDETPEWLLRHFTIISGTLTMEKVYVQEIGSSVVMEQPKMVYMNDPAISFGNFALPVGWIGTYEKVYAKIQDIRKSVTRRETKQWAIGIIIAAAVISLFALLISVVSTNNETKMAQEYHAYVKAHSNGPSPVYTIKTGQYFSFPKPYDKLEWKLDKITQKLDMGPALLTLVPVDSQGSFITNTLRLEGDNVNDKTVYYEPNKTFYGDINLSEVIVGRNDRPILLSERKGVRHMMHVIRTTDSTVTYSVSTVPESKN